jgi:sulfide:quinone oxidoreductase
VSGVRLICGASATIPRAGHVRAGGETLHAGRVVTVPRLRGPRLAGLPSNRDGFIPTDHFGRIPGVDRAFAAGDATDSPNKQGGVACAQADAAASAIAALAHAPVRPRPASPVLRAVLITAQGPLYLERDTDGDPRGRISEHALWWPPVKIASRRLSPRLLALAERAGALEPGSRLTVPLGTPTGLRGDTAPIEILSLQDGGHDAGT